MKLAMIVAALNRTGEDRLPEPMIREGVLLIAEMGLDPGIVTGWPERTIAAVLSSTTLFRHGTEHKGGVVE